MTAGRIFSAYLQHLHSRELGLVVLLAPGCIDFCKCAVSSAVRHQTMQRCVAHVVSVGTVFKILRAVVRLRSVDVVHNMVRWAWANKCGCHQLMDFLSLMCSRPTKDYVRIPSVKVLRREQT